MPPIESEPRDQSPLDSEPEAKSVETGTAEGDEGSDSGRAEVATTPHGEGREERDFTAPVDLAELRELVADEIDSLESRLLELIERISLPEPEVVEVPVLAAEGEEPVEAAAPVSSLALRKALTELDEADSQSEVLSRLLEQCSAFSPRVAFLLCPTENDEGTGSLSVWNALGFDTELTDATIELPAQCGAALRGEATLRFDGETCAAVLSSLAVSDAGESSQEASAEQSEGQALLIPFILRDTTRAVVLCADDASDAPAMDADALQVLCFVAAQLLETLPLRSLRPAATLRGSEWAIATDTEAATLPSEDTRISEITDDASSTTSESAGAKPTSGLVEQQPEETTGTDGAVVSEPAEADDSEPDSREPESSGDAGPAADEETTKARAGQDAPQRSGAAAAATASGSIDPAATVALPSSMVNQLISSPPPPPPQAPPVPPPPEGDSAEIPELPQVPQRSSESSDASDAAEDAEPPEAPGPSETPLAADAERPDEQLEQDAPASERGSQGPSPDREITRHELPSTEQASAPASAEAFDASDESDESDESEAHLDASGRERSADDAQSVEQEWQPERFSGRPPARAPQPPAISPLSSGTDLLGTEPEDPTGTFELQDIEAPADELPASTAPEPQSPPHLDGEQRVERVEDVEAGGDASEAAAPGAGSGQPDAATRENVPQGTVAKAEDVDSSGPPKAAVFDSLSTTAPKQGAFNAFSSLQPSPPQEQEAVSAAPALPDTEATPTAPAEPSEVAPSTPEPDREATPSVEATPTVPVVERELTTELSAPEVPSARAPRAGRAFDRASDRAATSDSTSQVLPPDDVSGPGWAFQQPKADGDAAAEGSISASSQPAHEEARRLARLLVSEIKLYNEDQIERGRQEGNIYNLLREDIDRSRRMYEERIEGQVLRETDYFRQELLRSLAGGDASVLGC